MRAIAFVLLSLLVTGGRPADCHELGPGNFVLGYVDGLVVEYDANGDVVWGFFSGISPIGLDVTEHGEIVTLDVFGTIRRHDADGREIDAFPSPVAPPADLMAANGDVLAIGAKGEILIQDDTTVYVLGPLGEFVDFYTLEGDGAAPVGQGLAALADGGLLAAVYYFNDRVARLFQLASDGSIVDVSEPIADEILGVASEPGHVLYATPTENPSGWATGVTLVRRDSTGAITESWSLPSSGSPYDLGGFAVVPVPEPSAGLCAACALVCLLAAPAIRSAWGPPRRECRRRTRNDRAREDGPRPPVSEPARRAPPP